MNIPNLRLACEKCCATCLHFKSYETDKWCGLRPPYDDAMDWEDYDAGDILYDDFADINEGLVCDHWEAKE